MQTVSTTRGVVAKQRQGKGKFQKGMIFRRPSETFREQSWVPLLCLLKDFRDNYAGGAEPLDLKQSHPILPKVQVKE